MSKDIPDYFELAEPGSSLRLCRELEKKLFPDLRGNQQELLKVLCLVAYNSQNYRGMCGDAWLRTTISLRPGDQCHHVLSAESFECAEMARIMSLNSNERGLELQRVIQGLILPEISSKIEIKSTILPRGAYLERLKESEQRQSYWAKVQSMLMGTLCCASGREFYPKSILYIAYERNVSLTERVKEWRRNRGRCDLAIHLQNRDHPQCLITRTALREIPIAEVKVLENIAKGSEGNVQQVLWRDSTYAMKSCTTTFESEEKVSLRVLHPHVATAFGYSIVNNEYGDSVPGLLMEMMTEDLFRLINVKNATSGIIRPLSRVESLDMLLQVGMAMEYMHTKNVVHGDLKPHNILISPFEVSGNERYLLAKVTDFGCAKIITPGQNLQISGGLGTPAYAAPEVLRREIDFKHPEKIDVYGFGAVAYEVLTGYEVYDGDMNRSDKESIKSGQMRLNDSKRWKALKKERRYPIELIELVETCFEWDPKKRPAFSDILAIMMKCKSTVQWVRIRSL